MKNVVSLITYFTFAVFTDKCHRDNVKIAITFVILVSSSSRAADREFKLKQQSSHILFSFIPAVTQIVFPGDCNFDAVRLERWERCSIVHSFLLEYGLIVCDHLGCNQLDYTYHNDGLNC